MTEAKKVAWYCRAKDSWVIGYCAAATGKEAAAWAFVLGNEVSDKALAEEDIEVLRCLSLDPHLELLPIDITHGAGDVERDEAQWRVLRQCRLMRASNKDEEGYGIDGVENVYSASPMGDFDDIQGSITITVYGDVIVSFDNGRGATLKNSPMYKDWVNGCEPGWKIIDELCRKNDEGIVLATADTKEARDKFIDYLYDLARDGK